MWSKLLPVGIAIAVGLQGCIFGALPLPVKVHIGHTCDDAATKVQATDGFQAVTNSQDDCDSLDAEELKKWGVEDCADVLDGSVEFVLTTECEIVSAEKVSEACAEVSTDCKDSVESTIAEWNPEPFPEDATKQVEEGEAHVEEALALISKCGKSAEKFVNNEKDAIDQTCSDEKLQGDLETMGSSADKCTEYVAQELIEVHGVFCCLAILEKYEDGPPDDADGEFLQKEIDAYFDKIEQDSAEETFEPSADRLRLYKTFVKTKQWRVHRSSFTKWSAFAGVALISVMALVIVGRFSKRNSAPAATDEEALVESAE